MANENGKTVGVLGTGIIGEATAMFFAEHCESLGLGTVWCLKNSVPREHEIPSLRRLQDRGVILVTWDKLLPMFDDMGLPETQTFSSVAGNTAVVIDCSPDAKQNNPQYDEFPDLNVVAHGGSGRFGDGIFVEGVNRSIFRPTTKRMTIGSCNTNGGATIALAMRILNKNSHLVGQVTVLRRASDVGQQSLVASVEPQVDSHHAADIMAVLAGNSFRITSNALLVPQQMLHVNVATFDLATRVTEADVRDRLSQTRVALTRLRNAGEVFYCGMTHGFAGRLLMPAVVPVQNIDVLALRDFYRVSLVYYVPQMGNVILPSVAAALWMIHRNWGAVDEILGSVGEPYLPKWI